MFHISTDVLFVKSERGLLRLGGDSWDFVLVGGCFGGDGVVGFCWDGRRWVVFVKGVWGGIGVVAFGCSPKWL